MSERAGGLSEQEMQLIQQRLEGMSQEDVANMVELAVQQYVVPMLQQIRQRRAEEPPVAEIRRDYKSLDDATQQDIHDAALMSVIESVYVLRTDWSAGIQRVRQLIRDPHTVEALLLIFENEAIDEEYREDLKEVAGRTLKYIGVAMAPEMYEPAEVEAVADELGLDLKQRG